MYLLRFATLCAYTCTVFAFLDDSDASAKSKNVSKRYDLDLQTCIENFDVHLDKIIRTQDSRAMGANYINEFDVSSREECLRLCCETDTCDVFVFEEKSPGSCYLFHCGSPDDFKCKFTKHHNYTSAVLTVSKHMTELESQIKLTKHEEELTRLRKPPLVAAEATAAFFPPTTNAPSREVVPVLAASSNNGSSMPGSRSCSRYQFECRSSGECIAIYNACDGIPQCSDASDEAPELGCPAQVATSSAPSPPPPVTPPTPRPALGSRYQQQPAPVPAMRQLSGGSQYGAQQRGWQQDPAQPLQYDLSGMSAEGQRPSGISGNASPDQHQQQQQRFLQPPQSGAQHAGPAPRVPSIAQGNLLYGREGEGYMQWPPYQQYHKEYDDGGNSHIFNHKSSGLMSETDSPAGLYGEGLRGSYYVGGNGDSVSSYRQPVPNSWQQQASSHDDMMRGGKLSPDYYYEDNQDGGRYRGRRPPPAPLPDPGSKAQEQPLDGAPRQDSQQRKGSIEVEIVDARFTTATTGSATTPAPTSTPAAPSPQTSAAVPTSASRRPGHHKHRNKGSSYAHPPDDDVVVELVEDQEETWGQPVGAVLSLALGLCVTCIMVVLVACRLRVVRRRLRRGGKSPYAHDADYLVNGMYL